MLLDENSIIFFLGASAAVKIVGSILCGKGKPKSAENVGKISRLVIYPVKSMRGIDVNEALCTQRGLKFNNKDIFDRNYMVVSETGKFITGRAYPILTKISVSTEESGISLNLDGFDPIFLPTKVTPTKVSAEVWGEEVEGYDCGDDAAQWISSVINKAGVRLIYGAKGLKQRELNKRNITWTEGTKQGDNVTYADGFPIHLLSSASVADLRTRSGKSDLIEDQFRPNIVISGCEPYDEDSWFDVWIGNTKFSNLKPCTRCIFTTIDPRVGKKDEQMEPLRTMRKYRLLVPEFGQSPCFGVNLVVDTPGQTIRVGDSVHVLRK